MLSQLQQAHQYCPRFKDETGLKDVHIKVLPLVVKTSLISDYYGITVHTWASKNGTKDIVAQYAMTQKDLRINVAGALKAFASHPNARAVVIRVNGFGDIVVETSVVSCSGTSIVHILVSDAVLGSDSLYRVHNLHWKDAEYHCRTYHREKCADCIYVDCIWFFLFPGFPLKMYLYLTWAVCQSCCSSSYHRDCW